MSLYTPITADNCWQSMS